MINIFTISVLLAGQPFQVPSGGLGATGLESRAECPVPLSGALYGVPGINSAVRVCGYVFDSKIETEDFSRLLDGAFKFINSDDQIEPIFDPVIDEIGLSGIGKVDPVEFTCLVLTYDDRNFNSVVPEPEADGVGALESTEPGVIGYGCSRFKPMNIFLGLFGLIRNSHDGNGTNHKLGWDACGVSELVVDEFLYGPFTESLV